ncbi:hypothetical protein [Streptomyces sp. NPDC091209]|uniref:hypothetical protein n=1 Tax=Streptomyces sp. NPDC091209 TaxID=3365974 RepID=UPI003811B6EC
MVGLSHATSTGKGWADRLFMAGPPGLGPPLIGGIALRISAVAGTVKTGLTRVAERPPARHPSDGSPSLPVNPFVDHHLVTPPSW